MHCHTYVEIQIPRRAFEFCYLSLFMKTTLAKKEKKRADEAIITSVMRILARKASALFGSWKKSDVVSPVKATSGHKMVSVIW